MKVSPMVLGKEEIMFRLLLSFLPIGVLIISVSAFAEDPYQNPPVYGIDEQLEDLRSMAELVVLGTTGERKIEIEEVLFGKPMEQMEARSAVPLGKGPRVPPGRTGVWFLVRGPDGYAPINPDCTPVLLTAFKALPKPADHWTSRANLAANRHNDSSLYYRYTKPGTDDSVRHGTSVDRFPDGDLVVELNLDKQRQFKLMIDSIGSVKTIARYPAEGHGFFLDYHKGRLVEFLHFKNLKRHGVYRMYSREIPERLIEEKHFTDGIIDGRCREWDEKGNLVKDETYELGFLPPVIHYTGKDSSGITLHRSERGVTYARAPNAPEVSKIKVGMTVEEVSDLLKIDFSPSQGLMFWFYQIDEYLHIKFKDNKVSEIKTGANGVTPGFRRR